MSKAMPPADIWKATSETLERELELSEIDRLLGAVVAGHGRLLNIEGPSGIGKTRLLDEARVRARASGIDVLRASGGELERDYPYAVVLRLLESRFSDDEPEARERLFRGRAGLAAPLLVGTDDASWPPATTDEFALMHGLYWCVVNLAERRPLALLVDDVHWADDLSLRFLIYLAQRLDDLPLALVTAIRSDDPRASSELVSRLSSSTREPPLRPAQLSLAAVRRLFAAADLVTASTDEFARASWEATGGNPFLVHELITAIEADPEAWSAAPAAQVRAFAPHSVGRSVLLRVRGLGDDAVKLATACAILGDEIPLRISAQLAKLDLDDAVLSAERLLVGKILTGVDPPTFTHPMIRSAVYGEIPTGERSAAHAEAARLLHLDGAAPDRVAHHLLAGTPTRDAWAREALHDGARVATRKGASGTAVRYLRRAMDLAPAGDLRPAILIDLGLSEAAAGEMTSLARFEEALGIIDKPEEKARAMYALGRTLYRYGRHDEAATTFQRGAELFRGQDRELALRFDGAFMCAAQYVVHLRGDLVAALEASTPVVDERAASGAERVVLANQALFGAMTLGSTMSATESARLARGALADGGLLVEETSESMAVNLAILALLWCGQVAEAQRAVEQVIEDARKRGAALAFAEASMVRAMVMYARGDVTTAMADAQASIDGMERGWHAAVPTPHAVLVQCLVERGELDAAGAVLSAVEPALPSPATGGLRAWFHYARGRLRLARAEWHDARDDLVAVGDLLGYLGAVNPAMIPWRSRAAQAVNALGDRQGALELVEAELELARVFDLPVQTAAALGIRGLIDGGDGGRAALHEAAEQLDGLDSPLELAQALLFLGSVDRRAGRRVACREPLRKALDLAHNCGATGLEQQARSELLASGARPRRSSMSGVAALTPSERRIAELAAAGHSNRGIAETLFLTKNTVQWHLRHIYQKLDVSSRDELKARFDHQGGAP